MEQDDARFHYATQNGMQFKTYEFLIYFLSSPEDMLIEFRERGREGERKRNIDAREKH